MHAAGDALQVLLAVRRTMRPQRLQAHATMLLMPARIGPRSTRETCTRELAGGALAAGKVAAMATAQ